MTELINTEPSVWILGSGEQCPGCAQGQLSASRDGQGEVDGYYCTHCLTAFYDCWDLSDDDMECEEGLCCDIEQRGMWVIDPTPRPPVWKKTPEQIQAEAAYQQMLACRQEQQQARERGERMARDYQTGILYVMPAPDERIEQAGDSQKAEAGT